MRMPVRVAEWLQDNLHVMATDDLSAISFASGESNDGEQWQLAVDMIYRCLVSGLINVYAPLEDGLDAIERFVRGLAEVDPFDRSEANWVAIGVWLGPLFHDTDRGMEISARYGLVNADAAEVLARGWKQAAENKPECFPVGGFEDANDALKHVDSLFNCAAISRAAGWISSGQSIPLNEAFIEEVEAIFEECGVPWSCNPLIPVSYESGSRK